MERIESVLSGIDGGRVLDVATQEGGFVQVLIENLQSYTEIVGIDVSEPAIEAARKAFAQANIQFLVMDAEQLDFADESFDTVSISASLHHLSDIPRVLKEMKRVLKPGGHFVLVEMHRDAQTDAERTWIQLHHWAAEVDSAMGRRHNSTLARQEFLDYMDDLGLIDVKFHDITDSESDPMQEANIELLEGAIERLIQRVEEASADEGLIKRGRDLLRRLHEVGALREPILMIHGKKG